MLPVGRVAPDIDAIDQQGRRFRLTECDENLCTVIYFFPKAFTPGCTRETKTFRDNFNELHLAGAGIVGVSTDDGKTQCEFAESVKAPFPMLADADGSITRAYDVRWPLVGLAQRVTYIVDGKRVILRAFHHELRIQRHRDEVLAFVDERFRARRA